VSPNTVGTLLVDELAYSRQVNRKRHEGSSHPDRNAQALYRYPRTTKPEPGHKIYLGAKSTPSSHAKRLAGMDPTVFMVKSAVSMRPADEVTASNVSTRDTMTSNRSRLPFC
jgi:hypothetical protein